MVQECRFLSINQRVLLLLFACHAHAHAREAKGKAGLTKLLVHDHLRSVRSVIKSAVFVGGAKNDQGGGRSRW
jgi:hypothetical protein